MWVCPLALLPINAFKLSHAKQSQVLFERGLEYHPRNTKIMTAYAKFETGVGGDPNVARELHRRAMKLDTGSGTDMHNRCEPF